MKATLIITLECNLSCTYCYMDRRKSEMNSSIVIKTLDFLYSNAVDGESIDIGFFGGEPFLKFDLLLNILNIINNHPISKNRKLNYQIVTNGSLITKDKLHLLKEKNIKLGISCDGIPFVQDLNRKFLNGGLSSKIVEKNIKLALNVMPDLMINTVYGPDTLSYLPSTIDYFYSLGVRYIFINADYTDNWKKIDIGLLEHVYDDIAKKYRNYHLSNDPAYINLIDSKITVILNRGYAPEEKCRMGKKEFAFGPEGSIYPCERLAGDCRSSKHCIGNLNTGINLSCLTMTEKNENITACENCSIKDFCMNWCGCSNYFSSGSYFVPSSFICNSEKVSLRNASKVLGDLSDKIGIRFIKNMENIQFNISANR